MAEEHVQQQSTQLRQNGNFRGAFGLVKNMTKDNRLVSRFNAFQNGGLLIVQAVGIVLALSSSSLATVAFAAAGGIGLAGIGLLAIGYGFAKTWMRLEELWDKSFPKFNPLKKIRMPLLKLSQKPFLQKIAHSRPLQKFTPRKQEAFLSGVTMEGAAVTAGYLALNTYQHVAALTAITLGNMLTFGMGWATWTAVTSAYTAFSAGKTLLQTYRGYKKEKKERACGIPARTVTAPPPTEKAKTDLAKSAPAFNKEAHKGSALPITQAASVVSANLRPLVI